jgi:nitrite reductase (NADH) large subunit
MPRLVVVGNGMAGIRALEEILARGGGESFDITVFGDEPYGNYNRIMLSNVLAGVEDESGIFLNDLSWYADNGITLHTGSRVTRIDRFARRVYAADGTVTPYDKLIIATGSRAFVPDIPGIHRPGRGYHQGVFAFRTLDDTRAMIRYAREHERAVVIGGGLLGLEAAYGLAKARAQVTVIHLMDRLMERQLDQRAALMLKQAVEAKGIAVRLEAQTARIVGKAKVEGVELRDGSTVAADAVVVAVGIRPSTELARTGGIEINRGIVVDDHLETSVSGIHAIGECAEHRGLCYGLVEPAYEQAQLLARRLAGEDVVYPGSVLATNLKVSGVNVFSAGDFLGATGGADEIVLSDPGVGVYKKLVIANDRLIGAVLFGDTADGLWYLDLIREGASIERLRDDLVFGRALATRVAA